MLEKTRITKRGLYFLGMIYLLATGVDVIWFLSDQAKGPDDYYRKSITVCVLVSIFLSFAFASLRSIKKVEHAEAFARNKEIFLNQVVDNLPLSVFAKDVKRGYRWILWNKMAIEQFQMPALETIGRVDYDLFPKSEADFFRETDKRVMSGREIVDIPIEPVTTRKGTWYSHTKKVPIYDEDGTPSILLGICEDITERLKAEEKLRDYEAVIKYSDDAILITTPELDEPGPKILYVNEAFTKMTGYTYEESVGKTPRILQGQNTSRLDLDELKDTLSHDQPFTGELINYHKNGTEYWLSLRHC